MPSPCLDFTRGVLSYKPVMPYNVTVTVTMTVTMTVTIAGHIITQRALRHSKKQDICPEAQRSKPRPKQEL